MSEPIEPGDRGGADPASEQRRRNALLEAEALGLRRFARALARDPDAAADLVQDTLAQALKAWGQWRGDGPLRAWLFVIMRNLNRRGAAREARWRAIAPPRHEDEDTMEDPIEARVAAPAGVDPVYLREVADAVASLPEDQRETLVLVAVEGLSYQEAADVIGAPIGTVMSRLSRARARVRAATDPDGVGARATSRPDDRRPRR
ncbi:MAG: sigma-70 family RNA polymerase sigma factor [Pseudomonadota bacterium]